MEISHNQTGRLWWVTHCITALTDDSCIVALTHDSFWCSYSWVMLLLLLMSHVATRLLMTQATLLHYSGYSSSLLMLLSWLVSLAALYYKLSFCSFSWLTLELFYSWFILLLILMPHVATVDQRFTHYSCCYSNATLTHYSCCSSCTHDSYFTLLLVNHIVTLSLMTHMSLLLLASPAP